MNSEVLRRIQMDIRKNFGKVVDWSSIPRENFNCYMFAVSNTIPTEIYLYSDKDGATLKSLVGEKRSFFGEIGEISGKTNFTDIFELVEALKSDMDTLGIIAEQCLLDDSLPEGSVKVAFYYDMRTLNKGKHGDFHFIRQEGKRWVHKQGWPGSVQQLQIPIEAVAVGNLELIGYFRLSLKQDLS